jgi:mannose/fructose/N-acetylgalactosamine-specific phosphotransferase system component IIC
MSDEEKIDATSEQSNPPQVSEPAVSSTENPAAAEGKAWGIAIAGWILPGLGHAVQRMWARAAVVFLVVGLLVMAGTSMRGNLFTSNGNDAFDTLGYIADMGTGSFYFAARAMEQDGADVSHAEGDYGTRFLATAGVLNLLAALHAFEAARGRKA